MDDVVNRLKDVLDPSRPMGNISVLTDAINEIVSLRNRVALAEAAILSPSMAFVLAGTNDPEALRAIAEKVAQYRRHQHDDPGAAAFQG